MEKEIINICPTHNQDTRKCDECMPVDKKECAIAKVYIESIWNPTFKGLIKKLK